MMRKWVILALLLAGTSAGCGSAVTPPPSVDAAAQASVAASVGASPSPSPSPTPSPSPIASPTAMPSETPTPWRTYTSEVFPYSIQYPPDWTVEGASAGTRDCYYANDLYPAFCVSGAPITVSMSEAEANVTSFYKSEYKATLISTTSIKLAGGYAGRILFFEGLRGNVHINIQVIMAAKGEVGSLIEWVGWLSETDADKVLFETIYTTWRPT
jgi:hypothetical protein